MTKLKILTILTILLIFSCASAPEETVEPTESVEQATVVETVEPEPEPVVEPQSDDQEALTPEPVIEPEPEPVVEPEPEPVVEPEPEPVVEPEPEPVVEQSEIIPIEEPEPEPEPLDETLLTQAKKDIYRAEQARAKTYFPLRLQDLKNKLREVLSVKESDPDRARLLLAEITEDAEKLTTDSLEALKLACVNIMENMTKNLLDMHADKYTPTVYNLTQEQKAETISTFEAGDFTKSLELYRTTYTSLTNLYKSLKKNLDYVKSLEKQIESYRVQGTAIEAEKWAPEEYQEAVDFYITAQDLLYTQYNALDGESALRDTLFWAKKAIKQAEINIEIAELDAEILALMEELEEASTLTILDREDNIIEPEEWEGSADLKEKPIEAEVEKDDTTGLEAVDLDEDVEVEFPEVSSLKIKSGTSAVLGIREKRRSLLAESKDLWKLGIEARNNGDLMAAREYLAKSKIFLDEYKSMAVDYIYTVILNPERRDCLWRIAEKDDYYEDPFLWPHIWERNRKLIQDPDLIYPGWKLIIPPIDEELYME